MVTTLADWPLTVPRMRRTLIWRLSQEQVSCAIGIEVTGQYVHYAVSMLLANSQTSDILSFGAYQFGSLRWEDDVDSLIDSIVKPVKN